MYAMICFPFFLCAAAPCAVFAGSFCISPDYSASLRHIPSPEVLNRTVVILGSSTAEGVGASLQSDSWAARLAQQLGGSGIRLINRSRAGTNTTDSLSRFDLDVIPHQPAFVILATSIVNEGFESSPQASFERYLANTRSLIARVREIGAIPSTITMYPYSRYTPEHLSLLGRLTRSLELLGWPVFNFWSPVATGDGRWIANLSADGLHPLDAGHLAMFDAIPHSVFPSLLSPATEPRPDAFQGSWQSAESVADATLLRVTPSSALSSWTLSAILHDPAAGENSELLSSSGDQPVRLLRRANSLELWVGGEKLLTRAEPPFGWHHVAISYQWLSGALLLSVDGAVWGEASAAPRKRALSFDIAAQCSACRVAQVLLYRANMNSADLAELAGDSIPRRSLEAWAPLTREFRRNLNLNAAQTSSLVEAFGSWVFDPASQPPLCAPPSSQPACPPGPVLDRAACSAPAPGGHPQ